MSNRNKRPAPPTLDVWWEEPAQAADGSYGTTIKITVAGRWEGGKPTKAHVAIGARNQNPTQTEIDLQNGEGTFPLIGLGANTHFLIRVVANSGIVSKEVLRMIPTPKPEKPKTQDQLALEKCELDAKKAEAELSEARAHHEAHALEEREAVKGLRVSVTGWNGKYVLHISVTDAHGKLIPGADVAVVNGNKSVALCTEANGAVQYPVRFKEVARYVEVCASEGCVWSETLPGPQNP